MARLHLRQLFITDTHYFSPFGQRRRNLNGKSDFNKESSARTSTTRNLRTAGESLGRHWTEDELLTLFITDVSSCIKYNNLLAFSLSALTLGVAGTFSRVPTQSTECLWHPGQNRAANIILETLAATGSTLKDKAGGLLPRPPPTPKNK